MHTSSVNFEDLQPGERYRLTEESHPNAEAYSYVKLSDTEALIIELNRAISYSEAALAKSAVYPIDRTVGTNIKSDAESPVALGLWNHYKRGRVNVQGVATDKTTGEQVVFFYVYSTNSYWTRPVADFLSLVQPDIAGHPVVHRFTKID